MRNCNIMWCNLDKFINCLIFFFFNFFQYINTTMRNLGWSVEMDKFFDRTPNFGKLEFENIVARLNPNASRYLALACHFDSKYTREGDFVGATDSAVPCAQMINLAKVMKSNLDDIQTVSRQVDSPLEMIFEMKNGISICEYVSARYQSDVYFFRRRGSFPVLGTDRFSLRS